MSTHQRGLYNPSLRPSSQKILHCVKYAIKTNQFNIEMYYGFTVWLFCNMQHYKYSTDNIVINLQVSSKVDVTFLISPIHQHLGFRCFRF